MKITVLNGSPKGMKSVTMQYVQYLDTRYPEHTISYVNVAQRINSLEKAPEELKKVTDEVAQSDMVLWAFPLYYLLCCSQYKRFIELIYATEYSEAFRGIPAALLTTSINFYDHTAHNYLKGICDDLGMPFCGAYSAESSDLFKEEERQRLENFMDTVSTRVESKAFLTAESERLEKPILCYTPGVESITHLPEEGKWLILADLAQAGDNLNRMAARIVSETGGRAELLDISAIDFKPCVGCCRCGMDNQCLYGEDDYVKMHRDVVRNADVIVFAGEIKDRYLSATWKRFFDRSFYMGHVPSLEGKQMGFLFSGNLKRLHNLREIFTAWAEMQKCASVDFVTDEFEESSQLDIAIHNMVTNLEASRKVGYIPPHTFRHVGGARLFRDYIWGPLRPVFQADHRYYRKNGFYNFPQKNIGTRLLNLVLPPILRIPPIKKKFQKMIPDGMIQRFRKIVESDQ